MDNNTTTNINNTNNILSTPAKSGLLKIHCFINDSYMPISGCKVVIIESNRTFNNLSKIFKGYTDNSGILDNIGLDTPSIILSYQPKTLPYGIYNVGVSKPGYNNLIITGVQVFPNVTSIQHCRLSKAIGVPKTEIINIAEHKMVTNSGSKVQGGIKKTDKYYCDQTILYNLINANTQKTTNMRVLNKVVVPATIIVHAGSPYDSSAPNYTVPFVDYIKNVTSSEIYSTWDSSAIRANVYCIVSFVLNRIYTEWYPSHGDKFDITNDTACDIQIQIFTFYIITSFLFENLTF